MIADSDLATRLTLTSVCVGAGYHVMPAETGPAALELVDEHPVDVVITRFYMPASDGFDFVLQLLSRSPLPIIVALTEGDRFISGRGLAMTDRLGVDRVLSKPYSTDTVIGLLQEVLP